MAAVVALAARGGVGRHHRRARLPPLHAGADLLHHPRDLVAEHGRRHDHLRVVAAAEDLGVGAAREGHPCAQQHVSRLQARNGDPLDPHVLLPVEDGRPHLPGPTQRAAPAGA